MAEHTTTTMERCPDCTGQIKRRYRILRGKRYMLLSCGCGTRWVSVALKQPKQIKFQGGTTIGMACGCAWGSCDCDE